MTNEKPPIEIMQEANSVTELSNLYPNDSLKVLIEYSTTNYNRLFWFIWGPPGVGKTAWSRCYHNYLNRKHKRGRYTICKTNGTCVRSVDDIRTYVKQIITDARIKKGEGLVNTYVFDECHDFASPKDAWSEFKSLSDELMTMSNPGVRLIFLSNKDESIIKDPATLERFGKTFHVDSLTVTEAISFVREQAEKYSIKIPNKEEKLQELFVDNIKNVSPRSILIQLENYANGYRLDQIRNPIGDTPALDKLTDTLLIWCDDAQSQGTPLTINIENWIMLMREVYPKQGYEDNTLIDKYAYYLKRRILYPTSKVYRKEYRFLIAIIAGLQRLKNNTVQGNMLNLINEVEYELIQLVRRKGLVEQLPEQLQSE